MKVLVYLGLGVLALMTIVASGAGYWLTMPEETVPYEVVAPEEAVPDEYEKEVMPSEATPDAEERVFAEEMAADEAEEMVMDEAEEEQEEVQYYTINFSAPGGSTIFSSTTYYGAIDIQENAFTWTDRDGMPHYFVPSSGGVHITISEVIEPVRPPPPPPPPPRR
ncbi:MAG: hypothetical protein HYT22_01555 [Candidatus Niyogibacteria bacterium]|nr:hypothetical protein [Candidatus Niyogibacteria bacterium]